MKWFGVFVVIFSFTIALGTTECLPPPPVCPECPECPVCPVCPTAIAAPVLIELCAKGDACPDPPAGEWPCDASGAGAIGAYVPEGPTFSFVLEGVVPRADTDYVAIYYPDPWPGEGLICLSAPTLSGSDGAIAVSNSAAIGTSLPIATDDNLADGAKIWLVPASMVDCEGQVMANWSDCEGILFEKDMANRVFYNYVAP